jgi:hypothetical protein
MLLDTSESMRSGGDAELSVPIVHACWWSGLGYGHGGGGGAGFVMGGCPRAANSPGPWLVPRPSPRGRKHILTAVLV